MDDLRRRFAVLDAMPAPDVWAEVERRASAIPTGVPVRGTVTGRPWAGTREGRRVWDPALVALVLLALLVALLAGSLIAGAWWERAEPIPGPGQILAVNDIEGPDLIDVATGKPVRLPGYGYPCPSLLADGRVAYWDDGLKIYAGPGVEAVTVRGVRDQYATSYVPSPSRRYVARFIREEFSGPPDATDFYRLQVIDLIEEQVVAGPMVLGGDALAWSGDERTIAFSSADGIEIVNRDGSDRRVVVDGATAAFESTDGPAPFALSADGRWLAVPGDGEGLTIHGTLHEERIVVSDTGSTGMVAWSPVGDGLAFIRSGMLLVRSPDGELRQMAGGSVDGFAWAPTGDRIAAWTAESVVVSDVASEAWIRHPTPGLIGVAWAPEGRRLATLRIEIVDRATSTLAWSVETIQADSSDGPVRVHEVDPEPIGSLGCLQWGPALPAQAVVGPSADATP